jgi:hypothetical protein
MGKIWEKDFKSVDELLLKLQKHRYWKMISEKRLKFIFYQLHENSLHIPMISKASHIAIDDMQRIRDFLIVSEEYDLVKNNFVELAKLEADMELDILSMFAITLERLGAAIAQEYPYSHLNDEEVKQLMFMAELSYQSSILCDRFLLESYYGVIFCCCAFFDLETAQLWKAEFYNAMDSLNKLDASELNYYQKTIKQDPGQIDNLKNMIEEIINEHRNIINRDMVDEGFPSEHDEKHIIFNSQPNGGHMQSMTWKDGIYKGSTKQGKPHGNGTWTHPNGTKYEGEWKDGMKHGKGIMSFPNGSRYTGDFVNGLRHGLGKWTHPDDSKYDGEWENGKPQGKGTIVYKKGGKYTGEIWNGKRHGQGLYEKIDGCRLEGLWDNNKLVETLTKEKSFEQTANTDFVSQDADKDFKKGVENISDSYTPQIRPWVRYFARMTDFYLFNVIFIIVVAFFLPNMFESLFEIGLLATALILAIWTFFEAFMLSMWGTTPGKWLLSTSVLDVRNNKLSYSKALSRSWQVYIKGLGLGIVPFNIVAMIIAYHTLTRNKLGRTTWDLDGGYRVRHKKLRSMRVAFLVLFWMALIIIITLLISI